VTRRIHRLLLGALALTLVSLQVSTRTFGAGPQAAQDRPPAPTFRTEANYVRVDVFPTANGVPVANLMQSEFEVLDNGVPQKIEQFERVTVQSAGPQAARIEPSTVRESLVMVENPRARVFVLFLDPAHVEVDGSARIRKPLVEALDKFLGVDDLIGVMTPEMSPNDLTFSRKTTSIETMLTRYWYWGERDRLNPSDPAEQDYRQCYPDAGACQAQGIADEMIDRRREKRTLDALEDLVSHLRGVREERKAVLAITDGWLLFRPNPALTRGVACQPPSSSIPAIGVNPQTGKLGTIDPRQAGNAPRSDCERDRIMLSQIDDDALFRRILDEANRSNTSFYPLDPRGLAVFDTPIVRPGSSAPTTPPAVDRAMLQARRTSLERLADDTDGLAIVGSNDLAAGFKRLIDDLTSYYLLGYYTSARLDGKFHSITVRIKRPGVQVRARRGYLAAVEADVVAASRTTGGGAGGDPLTAAAAAESRAVQLALGPLDGFARPSAFRVQTVLARTSSNATALWVVGELGASDDLKEGADANVMLIDADGSIVATARANMGRGERSFRTMLAPTTALKPGEYSLRSRITGATTLSEVVRVAVPEPIKASGAMFARRGPSTSNKEQPTADLRFHRTEQLRVDFPAATNSDATARLLDRTGHVLRIPLNVTARDDQDGSRWNTVQLALAPLAAGDYVIEMSAGSDKTLAAFRVVP
jgi:VWFA-related protein